MGKNNPFACPSWEKQNYRMTPHRAEQLECLFGKTTEQIKAIGRNKGKYPAYLGIKHNLAKMERGFWFRWPMRTTGEKLTTCDKRLALGVWQQPTTTSRRASADCGRGGSLARS